MLKSCSRCGRIHARGDPCPVKCVKVVEKQKQGDCSFSKQAVMETDA